MAKLAFLPIAMPTPQTSLENLVSFENEFAIDHSTKLWRVLPILAPLRNDHDCQDQALVDEGWLGRFDEEYPIPPRWLFGSDQRFPELKNFLLSLPFRRLSHCNILRQLQEIPPHIDYEERLEEDSNKAKPWTEPASYKILLHGSDVPSFYVCPQREIEGRKFPSFPPGFNAFVVSDRECFHGAQFFPNHPKYIVSIFGLLDHSAHTEMLQKSLEKFGQYAIWF